MNASRKTCGLDIQHSGQNTLRVRLSGSCTVDNSAPPADEALKRLTPDVREVGFDTRELEEWDSRLLSFLIKLIDHCDQHGIRVDKQGLPDGVRGLLELASTVPERHDARRDAAPPNIWAQIGNRALDAGREAKSMIDFLGEAALSLFSFLRGKARYRGVDFWLLLQDCGPRALPIVSLISLLVGLILAFVGAVQLRMFGAQIYIADLVGLGMAREMGAMMTAIIMAGRTGAAFAAQLGTMQVNDEIDALKTLGLSPIEFLVLPRILALVLMMPLLCLYADCMGILGGALVSIGLFDISFLEYFNQTRARLSLTDFNVGIVKCAVFGVLVAIAGCMRGIQCGRSSSAVGIATTSAVVTAIVFIIVSDAIMTIIINALDI
jgi:phospholipid/cholesterol/gamma-HCH transport system permease protein